MSDLKILSSLEHLKIVKGAIKFDNPITSMHPFHNPREKIKIRNIENSRLSPDFIKVKRPFCRLYCEQFLHQMHSKIIVQNFEKQLSQYNT